MQKIRSKDGTEIAFVTVGEGPPVILVPGALNDHRGRASGLPLAAHLRGFTVVCFDRRGRGESGDTAPWSVQREIEDLAALIDVVGGTASVYGMSSGAMLALEAAITGAPIRKLALFEPPYIVEGTRERLGNDYHARLATAVAEGRPGDAVETFMREAVQLPGPMVDGIKKQPFWPHLASFGPSLLHDAAIAGDGSLPPAERLASVRVETLAMDGSASPTWMRTGVHTLAKALLNVVYRTLDGQTHDVDPAVLGAALADFFA
jgi:pimeloyl-ACP methyl ester carboxylesterase